MKKNLVLILIAFCLPLISFSQDYKFNFSVQSGASFPLGNFAEDTFDGGSFAETGASFSLKAEHNTFEHWSFGIRASVSFHSVNAVELIRAEYERDPFLLDLNIRAEPYRSIQLLAGASFHQEIFNHLIWNSGAMAGIMEARSSFKIYETEYFMIGPHNYRITHARAYVPSFLVYSGLEYKIKSYFSLLLNAEVNYSEVEFGFSTAQGRRIDHHDFFFWNLMAGFKVYL